MQSSVAVGPVVYRLLSPRRRGGGRGGGAWRAKKKKIGVDQLSGTPKFFKADPEIRPPG